MDGENLTPLSEIPGPRELIHLPLDRLQSPHELAQCMPRSTKAPAPAIHIQVRMIAEIRDIER